MAQKRKAFNAVIVDLIQIGSIYQYLVINWWQKQIRISIWENNVRKPIRRMTTYDEIDKFYRYLLNNWSANKIKVTIWEKENENMEDPEFQTEDVKRILYCQVIKKGKQLDELALLASLNLQHGRKIGVIVAQLI